MKQVKFLLEVVSIISVIAILVFAKITYTHTPDTLAVKHPAIIKPVQPVQSVAAEERVEVFPGLINSRFIIVNY